MCRNDDASGDIEEQTQSSKKASLSGVDFNQSMRSRVQFDRKFIVPNYKQGLQDRFVICRSSIDWGNCDICNHQDV